MASPETKRAGLSANKSHRPHILYDLGVQWRGGPPGEASRRGYSHCPTLLVPMSHNENIREATDCVRLQLTGGWRTLVQQEGTGALGAPSVPTARMY